MAALEIKAARNNLKNVKELFLQFVSLSNHITDLHSSIESSNGPKEAFEPNITSVKSKLDLVIQKEQTNIQKDFTSDLASSSCSTESDAIQQYFESCTVSSIISNLNSGIQQDFGRSSVSTLSSASNIWTVCSDIQNDFNHDILPQLGVSSPRNRHGFCLKHFNENCLVRMKIQTITPVKCLTRITDPILISTSGIILDLDDGTYLNTQVISQVIGVKTVNNLYWGQTLNE
ncbi:hypothetical protein Bhyg_17625, partial [Pseudolycoriella hygida]